MESNKVGWRQPKHKNVKHKSDPFSTPRVPELDITDSLMENRWKLVGSFSRAFKTIEKELKIHAKYFDTLDI